MNKRQKVQLKSSNMEDIVRPKTETKKVIYNNIRNYMHGNVIKLRETGVGKEVPFSN